MSRSAKFRIDTKGNVRVVDVCGAGTSCQEFSADIEKLLGVADESTRQNTDELYKSVENKLTIEQ